MGTDSEEVHSKILVLLGEGWVLVGWGGGVGVREQLSQEKYHWYQEFDTKTRERLRKRAECHNGGEIHRYC